MWRHIYLKYIYNTSKKLCGLAILTFSYAYMVETYFLIWKVDYIPMELSILQGHLRIYCKKYEGVSFSSPKYRNLSRSSSSHWQYSINYFSFWQTCTCYPFSIFAMHVCFLIYNVRLCWSNIVVNLYEKLIINFSNRLFPRVSTITKRVQVLWKIYMSFLRTSDLPSQNFYTPNVKNILFRLPIISGSPTSLKLALARLHSRCLEACLIFRDHYNSGINYL